MVQILERINTDYLHISDDIMSPNFDVTIKLPYYEDDEMSYVKLIVKANDEDDAERKANRYINDKKRSANGIAWMDAYVDSVYIR